MHRSSVPLLIFLSLYLQKKKKVLSNYPWFFVTCAKNILKSLKSAMSSLLSSFKYSTPVFRDLVRVSFQRGQASVALPIFVCRKTLSTSSNIFRFQTLYSNATTIQQPLVQNKILEMEAANSRHYDPAFTFPNDTPIVLLDAKNAFEKLSEREKLYSHYLSRASFYGGLIVLIQTSPESPQIFRLIQRINRGQTSEDLFEAVKDKGITEDDFKAYLIYCTGIYTNMGNYKGFGDSKFVPDLKPEQLEVIVKNSVAWDKDPTVMKALWESCAPYMWSLTEKEQTLGLGAKGLTTYFSYNCTNEDSEKINKFFKEHNIEGYINRAIKTTDPVDGKDVYEIRNAGVEKSVLVEKVEFQGSYFTITTGDYDSLLKLVVENLALAKNQAANENEVHMLECYIESFTKGSLDAHKNGSRYWIKNTSPFVETYIGFIETYRDPIGMRGEFEGFVAMVNKEKSEKFQMLVENAENLLKSLPWSTGFEKDKFLRPDFTSLDVLAFSGSGIPAGINIPNYDEIRQSEGFKNVNLGNVVSASLKSDSKKSNFVTWEDHALLDKYNGPAFEVQVGLHELLGHGSGKLLQVDEKGSPNFAVEQVVNPLTNQPIDPSKIYQFGDSYDSVFTRLGSAYEECRAECVGLHLCVYPEVLKIFGVEDKTTSDDLVYVNWLAMCSRGLQGMEMFSPNSNEWKQAHSHARFVILNVMLEAGQDFVTIKETKGEDGQPDLLLTMDRSKLMTVGHPTIAAFLTKLQIFKSTADIVAANELFDKYSKVENNESSGLLWANWRDTVMARKRPRRMLVQANTIIKDNTLSLVEYEASASGMIKSWSERFSTEEYQKVDQALEQLYLRDQPHFAAPRN